MKIKKAKVIFMTVYFVIAASLAIYPVHVHASDGEEYITITVDAVDGSNIKYALDSDEPQAFGDLNEFRVPAGTSHTIYVKDEAGNITSQHYEPEKETYAIDNAKDGEDTQEININLELGSTDQKDSEYDLIEPAEPGTASVGSKVVTDGSHEAEKVFYTFTTKEGETLYLVVDQGQGTDNVYLLDTVSLADLHVLADGQENSYDSEKDGKEDNLLSILNENAADNSETEEIKDSVSKTSTRGNGIIILILAVIGGGAYYYLKIYRNKKDEAMDIMDAMDLDEFAPEEEEEEIEFDYDDAEKEEYLEQLINGEESFYNTDPDEYATSYIDDEYDSDSDIEFDYDMDNDSDETNMGENEE